MISHYFTFKKLVLLGLLINFAIIAYIYSLLQLCVDVADVRKKIISHDATFDAIENPVLVTLVIFDFEPYHNSLEKVLHYLNMWTYKINIVIISEKLLYPPVTYNQSRNSVIFVTEESFYKSVFDRRPENFIKTKFVMTLPDSAVPVSYSDFQILIDYIKQTSRRVIAVPVEYTTLSCLELEFDIRKWTLYYKNASGHDNITKCGYVKGNQGIFMKTVDLLELPYPFIRPYPLGIYLQLVTRKKIAIISNSVHLKQIEDLYTDATLLWKHRLADDNRKKDMFIKFGVKRVISQSGSTEYYGCGKHTERCFGTIINGFPDYLHDRKWTPPCCLKALRETAQYVFKLLEKNNVRYWLEGGSLLGAARDGDIIPWDYDVDIGIYEEDIQLCYELSQASVKQFIDNSGFLWHKAYDGDYYKVQYSELNHLHVDIFPFYSVNGTMTKNTWFKTHRQDTEFPEHYLKPLTKIQFAGYLASAPNNVQEFLELKFGPNVIENSRYPDGQEPIRL